MLATLLPKVSFFCLGFAAVAAVQCLISIIRPRIALRHVPGPNPSSFIWGEEWVLFHTSPGISYVDWHRKFGKVVRFNGAFGHQILSIVDPKAISYILGEGCYRFPKPRGVREWFKALLGEGILYIEGKQRHERQRRTLAPALSQQSVRGLIHMFHEASCKLASKWALLVENHGEEGVEIEVTDWAARFSLDVIGRAAFSHDFDCLAGKEHEVARTLDGLTNNENNLSSFYMRALFWIFPPILSIGKKGEMIRRTKETLGDLVFSVWKDAKIAGDSEGRTLLAMMLKVDGSNMQHMTEAQIVAQMRTVISAGYETVSATVAWLLYELAQNLPLQQLVREEILTVKNPSFDDLNNKFPLLAAVINETLRLHPPILENHHEAGETVTVPLSEPIPGTTDSFLTIPKGMLVAIPLNVIQTDSEVWGADADVFRPARWLERNSNKAVNRKYGGLLAFGEGPRSCIGKAFALAEIKVLVITLLQEFSFSCSHNIEAFQSFVVRPRIRGQGSSSLPLRIRKV